MGEVSKCVVEKWVRKRSWAVYVLWREAGRTQDGGEEQPDVRALASFQSPQWCPGPCCGPVTVRVYADVSGLYYHRRLWGCLGSILQAEAMLMSKGCPELAPPLTNHHLVVLVVMWVEVALAFNGAAWESLLHSSHGQRESWLSWHECRKAGWLTSSATT